MDHGFAASDKGFQIGFPNGFTLSVMFGSGNYCANRDAPWNAHPGRCVNAEVAVLREGHLQALVHDQVHGHVSPTQVAQLSALLAGLESGDALPQQAVYRILTDKE